MKYTMIFTMYYIYALLLIGGFFWAVLYEGLSEWWAILLICLLNVTPKVENKK